MDVPSTAGGTESAVRDPAEPEGGSLAEVLAALRCLQDSFDAKIRYDEVREQQIAALHQELEEHRRGLYQQILKPVLLDIIGLYDDIAKITATDGPMADDQAFLLNSVDEILRRHGVESFACAGDDVDRSRQRVIDVAPTDSIDADRKVAQRMRPGFEVDGKVLRPEWIVAYRYSPENKQPTEEGHEA
jgi:molecular chaperone GrpE (heat shock protein)